MAGEGDIGEVKRALSSEDGLQSGGPEQDHDGQVDEGAPCLENLAASVLDALLSLNFFQGGSGGLAEDVLGLPLLHDQCQSDQCQQRRDNVDKLRVTQGCEQNGLAAGIDNANHESYQTDLADTAQTVLNSNEQQGDQACHDLDNQDHFDGQVHAGPRHRGLLRWSRGYR